MARNGAGTYSLPSGNPVVTNTTISSTTNNNTNTDIATALTQSLAYDGQTVPIANLPMGTYRHTGVGNAVARTDYASAAQVQDSSLIWCGTAGGTANALTISPSPSIAAYATGQRFAFKAGAAANTSTTTVAISGLATIAAQMNGAACVGGEFAASNWYEILLDSTTTCQVKKIGRDTYSELHVSGFSMVNGTLTASVAANALTVAIKTLAGADPSAGDPVYVAFRNVTAATGDYAVLTITAATSIVVSSGSTLGTVNGTAHRLWITGFNDGGTFRMGIVNTQTTTGILALPEFVAYSSTAEGGAGAADSAGVIYTGTAVTSKSMRVLGFIESTQATAGTWATTPSRVHLMSQSTPMPGQTVQVQYTQTGAVATGTTTIPNDDTIPQITEGDQYLSVAITPTSALNRLVIDALGNFSTAAGAEVSGWALFQDATASALAAAMTTGAAGGALPHELALRHEMAAGTTSSTTFRMRAGPAGGATITINGYSSSRKYGGVMSSNLRVQEMMV